jgi:hypothetical protein
MDNERPNRKPRVALCIPAYDSWKAEMGYDAVRLAIFSAPHVDLTACFIRGQDTSEARNALVAGLKDLKDDQALDALLWIDADMRFPPDALVRLLSHRVPIVGADYRLRMPPFPRIGHWVNPANPFADYIPIPEDAPKTGLDSNMAVLGFGLILTHMRVFDVQQWPRPWFIRTWMQNAARKDNPSGFSTEDSIFCTMARACGFKIHCDLDLTAEVAHIGQMEVPWTLQTGAAIAARKTQFQSNGAQE